MSGPRLSIIPARAATDPALKPRDLQVLCVLGRHTDDLGWCRKSQVKMADEMGCARSTVFDAIERLVKAGYLERHVQEEDNGRDSPHIYRVILDPAHPSVGAVRDADTPCRYVGTPAGISAPPAGPESAPPAGSGPAPKNDPFRTTDSEREEKDAPEGEREDGGLRGLGERAFRRAFAAWPTFVSDSEPAARAAWGKLSAVERAAAIDRQDDYVAAAGKAGGRKTLCSYGVYLAEKRWEKLPEKQAKPFNEFAPPFGPVWGVWIWQHLISAPDEAGKGWPLVAHLFRKAGFRQGHKFAKRWHDIAGLMEAVPVGSAVFNAWRDEHARRGWPWIPDPGDQPVVFFPKGGPDGLATFEAAIRGEASDHDGGGREAAE
jgi:hypothetical protein